MAEAGPEGREENWERGVIEKLARSALDEQRKARNWSSPNCSGFVVMVSMMTRVTSKPN